MLKHREVRVHKNITKYWRVTHSSTISRSLASNAGRWGRSGALSPPEIRKSFVENWCYLLGVLAKYGNTTYTYVTFSDSAVESMHHWAKVTYELFPYYVRVYTFEEEAEIPESFRKRLWKSQFSIEILIKNSQFFKNLLGFSSFFVQSQKILYHASKFSLNDGKYSWNIEFLEFLPKLVYFLQNYHLIFNSSFLI